MLIALGTGLAPHLSKAVLEGMQSMAGEFVRTPKHGVKKGRYRARADLPVVETGLALLSFAAVVASVETGHYFATPFAVLFTVGYAYVALLIAHEQSARRRDAALAAAQGTSPSMSPMAPTSPMSPMSGRTTHAWTGEPSSEKSATTAPAATDLAA
jgi:hypothetical protein